MNELKPVILVDGSTYLFRAFHALPPLQTSKGEPTNVIRGVVMMLNKLQADFEGSNIVVVFDAPGKTFRDEVFPEYKATRPPIDPDLLSQIDDTHDVVRALGHPLVMVSGVEADDVIGTLAKQAADRGQRAVISTSDKDMSQLVNEFVSILDAKENVLDVAGVNEKFGVQPDQIIDFLALMGDKVDNIPGIPRVGQKTAAKWLVQYESIDGILENQDDIKGKVGESLREHADQLQQSRFLATIKCDVELEQGIDELQNEPADVESLTELYEKLEFKSLLRDLEAKEANLEYDAIQFKTITDENLLKECGKEIANAQKVSLVVEHTYEHNTPRLVGVGLCCSEGSGFYLPLGHNDVTVQQVNHDLALHALRAVLEDESVDKIGNNLKSLIKLFNAHDIELRGTLYDTMLMSYVQNSVASGGHHIGALANRFLARELSERKTLTGTGKKQIAFGDVDVGQATQYMAEQAWANFTVFPQLREALEAEPDLLALYVDVEEPFMRVLGRMELDGVRLDATVLHNLSHELSERIDTIQQQAFELADEKFSLASPKQLQVILYDKLELPAPKATKTGNRSTAENILRDIVLYNSDHPYVSMPQLVLDYRNATKLKSTYSDQLPGYINPQTGRVHTTYDQANATTGRLASSNPNLQNIPIRTPEGRRIRQAFVPSDGCLLVAADYSQIELRVMAHLSGDEGLQSAFAAGLDIHRATAGEVFSIPYEAVDDEHRRRAKAINFGLMYGMSAFGLARNLAIDQVEAKEHIELYFEHYPGIRDYMDSTREAARKDKFVTTVFGRRIYLNQIDSRNFQLRQGAERLAINAPVQGTAADIIKRATIAVDSFLANNEFKTKLILHVHDEMVFDAPEDEVDRLRTGVEEIMCNAGELNVPLTVDFGVGANWDEAH